MLAHLILIRSGESGRRVPGMVSEHSSQGLRVVVVMAAREKSSSDTLSARERSERMARVRWKDTKPVMQVRRFESGRPL